MLPKSPATKENSIIKLLTRRLEYTPDWNALAMLESFPVFVYDNYKRGYRYEEELEGARFLGSGWTVTDHYKMFKNNETPYVIEMDPDEITGRYPVRGDLWECDVRHVHMMDNRLQNNIVCYRKKVRIFCDYSAGNRSYNHWNGHPWIWALMYMADWNFLSTGSFPKLEIGSVTSFKYGQTKDKKFYFHHKPATLGFEENVIRAKEREKADIGASSALTPWQSELDIWERDERSGPIHRQLIV